MALRLVKHCRYAALAAGSSLALGAVLSGCAAEVNPVKSLAVTAGFATKGTDATQDFVKQSRPAEQKYMKVQHDMPARPTQPHSPDEVKALEQGLEQTRTATEAAGAQAQAAGKTPSPTPTAAPAE